MEINKIYFLAKVAGDRLQSQQILTAFAEYLLDHPDITVVTKVAEFDEHTAIVAVGGDGTMLTAMRMSSLYNIPAIGVNAGNVGFLTVISSDITYVAFMQLMTFLRVGIVQTRSTLLCDITDISQPIIAANDIVVSSCTTQLSYRLELNGNLSSIQRAMGVIVSTPSGSTAYSVSAGGAIVWPTLEVFQITPVTPQNLSSRPLILPANQHLKLFVWGDEIAITYDGIPVHREYIRATEESPLCCTIEYGKVATIIQSKHWNYFSTLEAKLG